MNLKRILVIRGGAIGDFILTLPAFKALRDAHPAAHIEILGYRHIAALAENRFYAQAVRSIEYGPLSAFFIPNSELPADLRDYFASFDLIISYLYDPDRIFENNLRRCGTANFISGPAKIDNSAHAAQQLARPMEQLGVAVSDFAASLYLSDQDRQFAQEYLRDLQWPVLAIHPGSGSKSKTWPIENWIQLLESGDMSPLSKARTCPRSPQLGVVIVSGEAEEAERDRLQREWKDGPMRFATNLPLTQLAAVVEQSIFIGHDSGISHLAAATGARCLLLFGPSDPEIWAPLNENVQVLRAPASNLRLLDVDIVRSALRDHELMRIGIST